MKTQKFFPVLVTCDQAEFLPFWPPVHMYPMKAQLFKKVTFQERAPEWKVLKIPGFRVYVWTHENATFRNDMAAHSWSTKL